MTHAQILLNSDLCERRAWYSLRWRVPALTPKEILYRAVEHGLLSMNDYPGEAAEIEAYRLATEIGVDTAESDLLGIAEHVAALANFITWLLRSQSDPWKRPDTVSLSVGSPWESGAFLSQDERSLRRVVLVDRWDAWAQMALENSWDVAGECSVYQVPIDCLIIEIGSLRKGRWSNPFTVGYRHPVSKTLRFRKRDGEDFGSTWDRVQREKDKATREEWLDAMTEDGVLPDVIQVHSVSVPERNRCNIALKKLDRIREAREAPEENTSMCFQKINPCPFRNCCPRGIEPSPEAGFIYVAEN